MFGRRNKWYIVVLSWITFDERYFVKGIYHVCLSRWHDDHVALRDLIWNKTAPLKVSWLNCSFRPLTFTKLRFWPPKKKTTKLPPKFCNCSSFAPPRPKINK